MMTCNVWIERTVNPHARRRIRCKKQEIEIAPTVLSQLQEVGGSGQKIFTDSDAVDDDYVMEIIADTPPIEETEEVIENRKIVQAYRSICY